MDRILRSAKLTKGSARAIATAACLLLAFPGILRAAGESMWETVRLVEAHGFSIRLRVRNRATLADQNWLILELENRSGKRCIVDNLHYVIDYEARPIGDGGGWSSGLCQGSVIQVFPRDWDVTPVPPHVLEQGRTREVVEALSYWAAANLQSRPPFTECDSNAELNVSATAHFWMTTSQGGNSAWTTIQTPPHGIPFTFRWGPPPQEAVPEMQQRFRVLCEDKDDISDVRALPSTRLACALLDIGQVADGLRDEEIENAAKLTGAFHRDLRLAALRCLFERNPMDRRFLVELDQVIRDNPLEVRRLSQSGFWHADLSGAIAAATRDPHARFEAQRLLDQHRSDWEHNSEIVRQLQWIDRERAWRSWLTRFGVAIIVAAFVAFAGWLRLRKLPARVTLKRGDDQVVSESK